VTSSPDALVVGGGVIGLAAAWRAAGRGLRVGVVDPAPARGASWVAAGMLAPVSEVDYGEEALVGLLVEAARGWAGFADELSAATGRDLGYRRCGTVEVALDHSDRAVLDELFELQRSLGLEAERLGPAECRRLVSALAPGVRGGVWVAGDHQVDNRALLAALLAAVEGAGVEIERAEVLELERDASGRCRGVRLAEGERRAAGSVVVAAGCGSSLLGGVAPGTLPPVRPVKGHILRLQGDRDRPLLTTTVRGLVRGRPCYLVPRSDGSVVIGATVEEKGFDRAVQAGAVHALLDDARQLVPGIDELTLTESAAGLRPGSPDNGPFVGWTDVPGLAVATGHYRNGILLAPLTAAAVADLLTGSPLPSALGAFDATRHRAWSTGPVGAR